MNSYLLTGSMILGAVPLIRVVRANRGFSLQHALLWATAAWIAWLVVFALEPADRVIGRYVALCLVGCAGVAVLGARRPHVGAWNFVVVGLLAVMVLPMIERLLLGTDSMDGVRLYFLVGTLAVGVLNYLPTRLCLASVWMLLWCSGEMLIVHMPERLPDWLDWSGIDAMLPALPWIAWLSLAGRGANKSEADRVWRDFRDRFGLVWSQRVREQFNHAAEHAGWPIALGWSGLIETGSAITIGDRAKIEATLRATMQRFLPINDT